MIGLAVLIISIALIVSAWYLWTYKKEETISVIDKCKKKILGFKNWLKGGVKKHKKKVIAVGLGATAASGGMMITGGDIFGFDATLIDSLDDYKTVGINPDHIINPIVYEKEVLCEGHMPLIINLSDNNNMTLQKNDVNNLVRVEKISNTLGDINVSVKILQPFKKLVVNPIYKTRTIKEEVKSNFTFKKEYKLVNETYISGYDNYTETWYKWVSIDDIDKLVLESNDRLVIDIIGNWKAGKIGKVDIVPTVTISSKSNKYSEYAWWNSNWLWKKEITLNSSQVPSTISSFPVCINITDTDLRDNAQSNGDDIAFTNSAEDMQLNHEIELYNSTTGHLVAWVNVTSLAHDSDTSIYMYYGNDAASNQENIPNVWNISIYGHVWHMNDEINVSDSTSNSNNGTENGNPTYHQTGKIGYSIHFDTTNPDYFSLSEGTLDDKTGTVMAIFRSPDDEHQAFLSEGHTTSSGAYLLWETKSSTRLGIGTYQRGDESWTGSSISDDNWHVCYWRMDDADSKYFVDGEKITPGKEDNGAFDCFGDMSGNTWSIGILDRASDFGEFNGHIDELRWCEQKLTDDWIETEYNSINNATDGGFFSMNDAIPLKIKNPYPADESTGQSIKPTCSILVNDTEGQTMDVTFASNYSGSWVNYQTNSSVSNGTYYWDFTGADSCLTQYWWKVYADNGTANISRIFTFTTGVCPSIQEIIYPKNESVWIDLSPTCIVNTTANSYFSTVDVTFSTNASGSWTNYQTNSSVPIGDYVYWDFTQATEGSTKYWWRVEVDGGEGYTNTYTYSFTTQEDVSLWQYYKEITVCDANNSNWAYLDVGNSTGGDVHCEGHVNNDFSDLRFYNYDASDNVTFYINSMTEGTSANVTIILPDDIESHNTIRMYYGKSGVISISDENVVNDYIYLLDETWSDGDYNGWTYDGLNCTQSDILFTVSTDECGDDHGGSCPQSAYHDYSLVLCGENFMELDDVTFLDNTTDYELKLAIHAKSMDDSGENARVIMWNGTSWNEIVQEHGNDDTWAYKTATIDASDIGDSTRFRLEVEGSNGCLDLAYFDNITIMQSTNRPYFCAFGNEINTKGPNIVEGSEVPTNGIIGTDLNPDLEIEIYHPLGLTNTIHYMTNSSGNWEYIQNVSSIVNGSSRITPTGYFTNYDTKYYWSVNVSDSANAWVNESYTFTTKYDTSGYNYDETITVSSSLVDENLSDFVLPVKINGTISKYCDDGDSILFTNMNGGKFYHETEYFSSTSPTYCHVRIPSEETITKDTNYQFKLYFNNSAATNQENATVVWENYDMVYHFSEDNGNITDWTGNGYDAEPKNDPIYRAGGTWAYAMDFNGTNEYCAIKNKTYSTTDISDMLIFSLIRSEAASGGSNRRIFSFDRSEYYCVLLASDSENAIWTTEADDLTGDVSVTQNTWKSITGVFDDGDRYLYIDESQNKADTFSTSTFGTGTTRYGFIAEGSEASSYDGSKNSEYFPGKIDEILVRESIPTNLDAWVKLKYNAYTNPDTLSGADEEWGDPVIDATSLDDGTCVSYEPDLTVNVSDPDNEKMDIYIYTNTSGDAVWTQIGVVTDVSDGSYTIQDITTLWDTSNTKYWYAVNVTDESDNYENITYNFTTADLPTIDTYSPTNGATDIDYRPTLWVNITSTCDEDATVKIYENSSGSWSLIDTTNDINNGESVSHLMTEATEGSTKYYWKVIIDIGFTDTTENIYNFTTTVSPTVEVQYPNHQSTDIEKTPTVSVWANESDGRNLNVYFYKWTGASYSLEQTNSSVVDGTLVEWIHDSATSANTLYNWSVKVVALEDSIECGETQIYREFTTAQAPSIDSYVPTDGTWYWSNKPNYFNVTISDPQGHNMDINLYVTDFNGDIFNSSSDVTNGTISHDNNSWITTFGQIYWAISVNNSKGFYTKDSTPYFYRGRESTALFTVSSNPSTNNPITFTNSSTNATSLDWNVGDGTTYTTNNVTHNYTYMGNYIVNLTINDGDTYWQTAYYETTIYVGYNHSITSGTDYFPWMGNTTNITNIKSEIGTANDIYYWDGTTWNSTGDLTISTFSVLKKNDSWTATFRTPSNRSVTYSDTINNSLTDGWNYIVWHKSTGSTTKDISIDISQSTPEFVSVWDGTEWDNYISEQSPDSYSKSVDMYDVFLVAMDDSNHWLEV